MAPPDGLAGGDSSVIYPPILAFSGAKRCLTLPRWKPQLPTTGGDVGCCPNAFRMCTACLR